MPRRIHTSIYVKSETSAHVGGSIGCKRAVEIWGNLIRQSAPPGLDRADWSYLAAALAQVKPGTDWERARLVEVINDGQSFHHLGPESYGAVAQSRVEELARKAGYWSYAIVQYVVTACWWANRYYGGDMPEDADWWTPEHRAAVLVGGEDHAKP